MNNTSWKQTERDAAKLFGGKRFPANSGHRIDGESALFVWQVKHRKNHTMADMFNLAHEMNTYGKECGKMGLVYLRDKPGRGGKATSLVVMTEEVFKQFYPTNRADNG